MQIIGVVNIWIGVLLLRETPRLENTPQLFHLHCTMPDNKVRTFNSSTVLSICCCCSCSPSFYLVKLELHLFWSKKSWCSMGSVGCGVFEALSTQQNVKMNRSQDISALSALLLIILSSSKLDESLILNLCSSLSRICCSVFNTFPQAINRPQLLMLMGTCY